MASTDACRPTVGGPLPSTSTTAHYEEQHPPRTSQQAQQPQQQQLQQQQLQQQQLQRAEWTHGSTKHSAHNHLGTKYDGGGVDVQDDYWTGRDAANWECGTAAGSSTSSRSSLAATMDSIGSVPTASFDATSAAVPALVGGSLGNPESISSLESIGCNDMDGVGNAGSGSDRDSYGSGGGGWAGVSSGGGNLNDCALFELRDANVPPGLSHIRPRPRQRQEWEQAAGWPEFFNSSDSRLFDRKTSSDTTSQAVAPAQTGPSSRSLSVAFFQDFDSGRRLSPSINSRPSFPGDTARSYSPLTAPSPALFRERQRRMTISEGQLGRDRDRDFEKYCSQQDSKVGNVRENEEENWDALNEETFGGEVVAQKDGGHLGSFEDGGYQAAYGRVFARPYMIEAVLNPSNPHVDEASKLQYPPTPLSARCPPESADFGWSDRFNPPATRSTPSPTFARIPASPSARFPEQRQVDQRASPRSVPPLPSSPLFRSTERRHHALDLRRPDIHSPSPTPLFGTLDIPRSPNPYTGTRTRTKSEGVGRYLLPAASAPPSGGSGTGLFDRTEYERIELDRLAYEQQNGWERFKHERGYGAGYDYDRRQKEGEWAHDGWDLAVMEMSGRGRGGPYQNRGWEPEEVERERFGQRWYGRSEKSLFERRFGTVSGDDDGRFARLDVDEGVSRLSLGPVPPPRINTNFFTPSYPPSPCSPSPRGSYFTPGVDHMAYSGVRRPQQQLHQQQQQKPQQKPALQRSPKSEQERQRVNEMLAARGLNPPLFNCRVPNARYFVIKSYTEEDVHKSLKYSIWTSTEIGNRRLNSAFLSSPPATLTSASSTAAATTPDRGPIYLFFSVNASGHFCGVAEMVTQVDWSRDSEVWAATGPATAPGAGLGGANSVEQTGTQDDTPPARTQIQPQPQHGHKKWKGSFRVKWIFVKDVPNAALRHLRVVTNENKPVTNSRDTQELSSEIGREVMRIFAEYRSKTCLLDDWEVWEKRERERVKGDGGL
ncbi:hypothetical protein HK104_004207 [Borealophlyctis nickersoniae]|nr:hypothetical protein HK104_004207 [Borealophlyctis nickersoniae]